MRLVVRWVVAVTLVLLSASSWAQLNYFTLIDSDNDTATGCSVTLPASGTVVGIERRLTAAVSETATPQVTQLTLESCVGGSFGAPVSLPGTPYPVGLNNSVGGADAVEQAVAANAVAAPGTTARLYFAAQGPTSDDLLGATSGSPILFNIQPSGGPTDIPFLSGPGFLVLALLLLGVVLWQRPRFPASAVGVLLIGTLVGIAWAAGFRLDGQIGDWQGVPAVGSDVQGDSASNTDIVTAFAAQEGGNLFFRTDIANAETTPSSNQPPVFTSTPITTANVASPYSYAVVTSDPDGNALTLTAPTLPAWLAFAPGSNGTGTLSGTPGPADLGPSSVVLRVTDNGTPNLSTDQTFTITVSSVPPTNQPPVIDLNGPATAGVDFAAVFTEDGGPVAIIDPANLAVTDPDSTNLVSATVTLTNLLDAGQETLAVDPSTVAPNTPITVVYNGATGVLTLAGNAPLAQYQATLRTLVYNNVSANPNPAARTIASVVNDGALNSAPATTILAVTPVNDAPVANAQTVSTPENTAITITLTGSDPDNDILAFAIATPPTSGTLGPITVLTATSASVRYTPNAGFTGSDGFTFTVGDSTVSSTAAVVIAVNAVNDPPVANPDSATVTEGGTVAVLDSTATSVLANDTDPDAGDILSVTPTPVSGPTNGSLTLNTNGTFSYTHNGSETTTDSFIYQVCDNGIPALCATTTVSITITPVNDPPVANSDSATVTEGGTVAVLDSTATSVRDNDTDADNLLTALTVTTIPVTPPANGSLTLYADGTFSYTHNGSETATDSFVYEICDPQPLCSTSTVSITITLANDAPVIDLPGPGVNYDTVAPIILDAAATVTDVDSPNFDTGVLTANVTTACDTDDRLGVRNEGTGPNQIGVSGADVTYNPGTGAVIIGTIVAELDCATPAPLLAITLTANADLTATQALLRNLAFFSASATPPTAQRVVQVVLTDGDGGTSNTATKLVDLDAAPSVSAVTPANNAAGVAIDADVVITFSEAVTVTGNWFQIACPTSGNRSALSGTAVTGGPTAFTINPSADFANGEACTVTVTATQITDQDATDPPDNMTADFNSTFTTIDIAPTVLGTSTPANGAVVPTNQTVVLNFSEAVDVVPANIGLVCGTTVTFTTSGTSNVTSITLTPTSTLPEGASCTLTVPVTAATDTDAVDPPDQLDAPLNRSFTVDTAPTFTGSTPVNGAIAVALNSDIQLTFSEAVNVTASSFGIDCGGGGLAYAIGGSGTASVTLNPTADLPGGASCTVTITGANVSDSDGADPPDIITSSPSFNFTTASVANDDSYNVTPHLTLNVDTGVQGGRVTANDQLGFGVITGFGFGSCSGTTPGIQLDAGATNGRLTLNGDGSFSYEPPAGVSNTTKTFCYTVSGGDTANIVFNLQNTELVWFVDAAATGGAGTQARPFQTLAAAAAVGVDTANDTIFVKYNASGYTCGITLENSEKLIGEGSGSNLDTLTGITPVTGSAFPSLTNSSAQWPTLTAVGADCVALSTTNNTIRGFNFGNVGAANSAIVSSGFGILTVNDAAIATNGQALNLSNGTFNATFGSVSSSGGLISNVRLNNIAGTIDLGSGALTGAGSGVAFVVNGGTGAITYGGNITAIKAIDIQSHSGGNITLSGALSATSGNTGINIANNTGGTITLSNASKVVTSAANPAVTLSNNTGATINFTGGGLAISTTGGAGFSATGGGTVTVQGAGNTITSTTGTALNVANTTIGASGLTFQSISAGTGSGSSGVGINLDSTGLGASNGGLAVTGTGTAGSGGTIQHKTGADDSTTAGIGIFLKDTKNPSFSWMQLNDFDNSAIAGRNVQGFTLQNSVINGVIGNNTAPVEGPINFGITNPSGTNGLQGTGLIHNVKISGGIEHNVEFYNQSGSMNLTIDGTNVVSEGANPNSPADDVADCIIEENTVASGSDGIQIEMQGTATATIVIDRCLFRDNKSQAVQIAAIDSAAVAATIDESVARKFVQGNEGFVLSNGSNGDLTALISNNRVNNFGGTATFVGQTAGNATASSLLNATISNSIITQPTTATNHGITAFLTSTVGQISQARVRLDGNNVTNNSTSGTTRGILVDTPDGSTSPAFSTTATNNSVSVGDNIAGVAGLVAQARQSSDACANIGSNTVTFPNGTPGGVNGLRARQVAPATYDLEQSAGCTGTAAAVLGCRNPASTTEVLGTLTVVAAGTCLLPSVP